MPKCHHFTGKAASTSAVPIMRATKLARLLGNPVRLRILLALRERPLCVRELMEVTGRSQANVSQHLMVLRAANLVRTTKESTRVVYSLRCYRVAKLLDALAETAAALDSLDTLNGMSRKPCRDAIKNGK